MRNDFVSAEADNGYHQDWIDEKPKEAIKAIDEGAELHSHDDVLRRLFQR